MSDQPLIFCEHLAKTFEEGTVRTEVLIDVNLSVVPGERIAVMGSSGAGKSTLLHLLGGLDKPTRGTINFQGRDLARLEVQERATLRNQMMGFVYQFHHLLPEFTALENVGMPLLIRGVDTEAVRKQASDMLARVGLGERLEHKPGEMSGGERQRAAVARALITRPQCVLADEPTGNLDHKNAERLYQLMMELNREIGSSLIVVTHEAALANQMDRTLVLEDGRLAF